MPARVLVVALVLAVCAGHALAQETGGSFDSEDWGSSDTSSSDDWGSSSGSSDWGSSDTSSSDDWGSSSGSSDWGSSSGSSDWGSSSYPTTDYDTSSSSSEPHDAGPLGFLILLLVGLAVVGFPFAVTYVASRVARAVLTPLAAGAVRVLGPTRRADMGAGLVDVSMLQIAIDWRARRFVQAELAKLAEQGDTQSAVGRVRLLRATTTALASVKLAWLYAGARNFAPMPPPRARDEFQRIANDVRATFRQEIVRASGGRVVTVEAKLEAPKEHEGPGVVLVSVVVAARREIFDVDASRSASIDTLLRALGALSASDVDALSVVWTPAAEDDRMSTAELEARHRHLVRLGDVGGRVFCGYCGGPFAQELAACPHCGAPSESAARPG